MRRASSQNRGQSSDVGQRDGRFCASNHIKLTPAPQIMLATFLSLDATLGEKPLVRLASAYGYVERPPRGSSTLLRIFLNIEGSTDFLRYQETRSFPVWPLC